MQTLPDGTVYYDTEQPTDEWFSEGGTPELYAWRKATENDDAESLLEIGDAMPIWTYDEATDTETITDYYIRVRPDEEGFYRFTRNGFFAVNALSLIHISVPVPSDYDLPVSEVPEFLPDVLSVRNLQHG